MDPTASDIHFDETDILDSFEHKTIENYDSGLSKMDVCFSSLAHHETSSQESMFPITEGGLIEFFDINCDLNREDINYLINSDNDDIVIAHQVDAFDFDNLNLNDIEDISKQTTDPNQYLTNGTTKEDFGIETSPISDGNARTAWLCSLCNFQADDQQELHHHSEKFHSESRVESLSSSSDKNEDNLPNSSLKDSKPYVCKSCGIRFAREKALASHEALGTCQPIKVIECTCKSCSHSGQNQKCLSEDICSKLDPQKLQIQTKKKANVRRKQLSSNEGNKESCESSISNVNHKIACPECEKTFATRSKMYRHKWIHRKKPFSCEVCTISFCTQNELDQHRLGEHVEEKKYMCGECGKSFGSRQGMWEHNRSHDSNILSAYKCGECCKNFSSRQGFLIHQRLHTGERPFECETCRKTFRDAGTLRKHVRVHTGERPHICPLCDKSFNQKVVMREHIKLIFASFPIIYLPNVLLSSVRSSW